MNGGELSPGDLARAVLHDDPTAVGDDLRDWHDADPTRLAAAVVWLRALADYVERTNDG